MEQPSGMIGALTAKQHRLLMFLREYIQANGFAPTYAEMASAIDARSKNSAFRMAHSLRERGLIETVKWRDRGINITDKGMQVGKGDANEPKTP